MSIIRFINKSLYLTSNNRVVNEDLPNYSLPNIEEIHIDKNRLEAVVLLTTSKEINNGSFGKFIKNLIDVTEQNSNLDFIMSVNNNSHTSIEKELTELKLYFKHIYYYNINIHSNDDIYTLDGKFKPIPKYGLASGPNILFIKTMRMLNKYNTVLTLETDCILYKNWLSTLINYTEYSGDFLISGSTYDGNERIGFSQVVGMNHINGVALYKTKSSVFQFLLNALAEHIPRFVENGTVFTAYDYCLMRIIISKLKTTFGKEYTFWNVVYRSITKNTFIINASLNVDKNIPEEVFLGRFPRCVILHKKLT